MYKVKVTLIDQRVIKFDKVDSIEHFKVRIATNYNWEVIKVYDMSKKFLYKIFN